MLLNYQNINDISELRKGFINALNKKGWPNSKHELWKYTSLDFLNNNNFKVSSELEGEKDFSLITGLNLNFFGGFYYRNNFLNLPSGIKISKFDINSKDLKLVLKNLPMDHLISKLTIGYMTTSLLIEIEENIEFDIPIILNFLGGKENHTAHPLVFFKIKRNSSVSIAEISASKNSINSPFIVYDIDKNSSVNFLNFQNDNKKTIHLSHSHFILDANSVVNAFIFSKGSKLSRIETNCLLKGENGKFSLSTVYLGKNEQHHDITSYVHHDYKNCYSNQIIRGVLDHKSRGVFQGKVKVSSNAQKTDGQQMSKSLMLSRDAEVNNKPELEIYADDVICTHGATVGELDKDMLFYLCSRGIPIEEAKMLLINGFIQEAIDKIENNSFKNLVLNEIELV